MERALIIEYQDMIQQVITGLTPDNYQIAVDLAKAPQEIKGFGPIKDEAVKQVKAWQKALM